MKNLLSAAIVCVSASTAFAGMACPSIDIHDVGSPNWLSNTDLLDGLESQQTWVGINHSRHDDGKRLNRIAPGSAAERAGLLPGDIVTMVNGASDVSFNGISVGQATDVAVNRDGAVLQLTLTMGRADPVHFALADAFESDPNGCPNARISKGTPILNRLVLRSVLTRERVFRCNDAHKALEFMGEDYEIGEAYLVRGSRRLLLTIPHFGTACIAASDLDGDALNQEAALAFLMEAAESYIDYQYRNP